MKRFWLVLIGLILLSSCDVEPGHSYSGAGSISGWRKGAFIPRIFNGDSTGFGEARDFCIAGGGGVITLGPGCENIVTTYPLNANLVVLKDFITGIGIIPFKPDSIITHNGIIARLGPASSAGSGGAIRIVDGVTFAKTRAGIQAALDDVPVGGAVFLPAGSYLGDGNALIPKAKTSIVGAGKYATIIDVSAEPGGTENIIRMVNLNGVLIRDIGFIGQGTQFNTQLSCSLRTSIYMKADTNITIQNCYFTYQNSDIGDSAGVNLRIEDCDFVSNSTNTASGFGGQSNIHLRGTKQVKIVGNHFEERATTRNKQFQYSLLIHQGPDIPSDVEVAHNTWEGYNSLGGATVLLSGNGLSFHHNEVRGTDNTNGAGAKSSHVGILLNNDGAFVSSGMDVSYNKIFKCSDGVSGFDALGSPPNRGSHVKIVGNEIEDCVRSVYLMSGGDYIDVIGNTIRRTVNLGAASPDGCAIVGRSLSNSTISNNTCDSTSKRDIFMETTTNSTASTNLKVHHNIITHPSNATAQEFSIYMNGVTSYHITNSECSNNSIIGSANNAIQADYFDDGQINGNILVDSGAYDSTGAYIALSNCARIQVVGNNCTTTLAATKAAKGIDVQSGSVDISVVENRLSRIRTTPINNSGTRTKLFDNQRSLAGSLQGRAVMVAGTVTVNTAEVVASDNILLTVVLAGGTLGNLSIGTIVAGTSFVINSNSATDTSTIFWQIVH